MVWLAVFSTLIFTSVVAGLWYVRTREASTLARLEGHSQNDYERAAEYAEFCPMSRFFKETTESKANAVLP
jgi:hypothetical protein